MNPRNAARTIDALRRGWPVRISGADGALTLLAVETADDSRLADVDPHGEADLLISPTRAATLTLGNRVAASGPAIRIRRAPHMTLPVVRAIADPALDLAFPMKGPFAVDAFGESEAARAALEIARKGHILPAFFVLSDTVAPEAEASVEEVWAVSSAGRLRIAARARLPVEASETAEIIAFRSPDDAQEHVALVVGKRDESVPVVRLHSECLTGDVLGSLKCDCGPQLHGALDTIAHARWGVLLYLRQEGRGIGLINKLRAYMLQDQGYDTVDANLRLGFDIDARDFSLAAQMLSLLGIGRVRLLTNNTDKVAGLEGAGIAVEERVPLAIAPNPHNAHYLDTKRDRTGHQL